MKTLFILITILFCSLITDAESIERQEPDHLDVTIIREYTTGRVPAGSYKSFHYIRYSRRKPREAYREATATVSQSCPEAIYTVEESHYDGITLQAFTGTITYCRVLDNMRIFIKASQMTRDQMLLF